MNPTFLLAWVHDPKPDSVSGSSEQHHRLIGVNLIENSAFQGGFGPYITTVKYYSRWSDRRWCWCRSRR